MNAMRVQDRKSTLSGLRPDRTDHAAVHARPRLGSADPGGLAFTTARSVRLAGRSPADASTSHRC